jgi:hypothetical protein
MVSDEGIVLTSTAQALTSSSDITMVIPQVLTAWDPATQCIYVVDGVSTKTLTTGSYLAIDCKIFDTQTGSYMIGDATLQQHGNQASDIPILSPLAQATALRAHSLEIEFLIFQSASPLGMKAQ